MSLSFAEAARGPSLSLEQLINNPVPRPLSLVVNVPLAFRKKKLASGRAHTLICNAISGVVSCGLIRCIQPVGGVYRITFSSSSAKYSFLANGLSVDGVYFPVQEADDRSTTVAVHRLPFEVPDEDLKALLSQYGEVHEISRTADNDKFGWETGSRKVKITITTSIPRALKLRGFNFSVYYKNQPTTCSICFSSAHLARVCPLQGCCRLCKEAGHVEASCPKRLSSRVSDPVVEPHDPPIAEPSEPVIDAAGQAPSQDEGGEWQIATGRKRRNKDRSPVPARASPPPNTSNTSKGRNAVPPHLNTPPRVQRTKINRSQCEGSQPKKKTKVALRGSSPPGTATSPSLNLPLTGLENKGSSVPSSPESFRTLSPARSEPNPESGSRPPSPAIAQSAQADSLPRDADDPEGTPTPSQEYEPSLPSPRRERPAYSHDDKDDDDDDDGDDDDDDSDGDSSSSSSDSPHHSPRRRDWSPPTPRK